MKMLVLVCFIRPFRAIHIWDVARPLVVTCQWKKVRIYPVVDLHWREIMQRFEKMAREIVEKSAHFLLLANTAWQRKCSEYIFIPIPLFA